MGEVLDFPGAMTCGANLAETRRLLAGALEDMAEVNLLRGEPLPPPNLTATDPEADLEEPIYLSTYAARKSLARFSGVSRQGPLGQPFDGW